MYKINVAHMTIDELKTANSIYLNNRYIRSQITSTTANLVREALAIHRPDIFSW